MILVVDDSLFAQLLKKVRSLVSYARPVHLPKLLVELRYQLGEGPISVAQLHNLPARAL
jgi:hypothetical protein